MTGTGNFDAVLDCYEAQARKFRAEHGRPAVLVVDGVENLSPAVMQTLICDAKACVSTFCPALALHAVKLDAGIGFVQDWADQGHVRVVFVTSPGRFLQTVGGALQSWQANTIPARNVTYACACVRRVFWWQTSADSRAQTSFNWKA